MDPWPALVSAHHWVHQRITELDRELVWAHGPPNPPASLADLQALESSTGQLPPGYREFLLTANGWPAFYQWVDLFGVDALLGPERQAASRAVPDDLAHYRDRQFLPVGLTRAGFGHLRTDVFLLSVEGARVGEVVWLGGSALIERFETFEDFFVQLTAYEELQVAKLAVPTSPEH